MILQALHIPDNSFRCAIKQSTLHVTWQFFGLIFLLFHQRNPYTHWHWNQPQKIGATHIPFQTFAHDYDRPLAATATLSKMCCFQFRRQKTYWHSIVSSSPLPFAVRSCQSSAIHDRFSWILTSYTLTDPRNIPCNIQHRNFRIHETDSFWKRRFCFAHVNNHVYPWYAFMSTCHRRVNKTSKLPVFSAKPPSSKM